MAPNIPSSDSRGSCMGGVDSVRQNHSLHISQRLCLTLACVVFSTYTPFSSTCTHVTSPPCCCTIISHRYHKSLCCRSHHRFHFATFCCSTVTCPDLFDALSWMNSIWYSGATALNFRYCWSAALKCHWACLRSTLSGCSTQTSWIAAKCRQGR